jgi:hypothetical protein
MSKISERSYRNLKYISQKAWNDYNLQKLNEEIELLDKKIAFFERQRRLRKFIDKQPKKRRQISFLISNR